MILTKIQIRNIKGFKGQNLITPSPTINLFTGKNNSGKSTILKSILRLQNTEAITNNDITVGQSEFEIKLEYNGILHPYVANGEGGEMYLSQNGGWEVRASNGSTLSPGTFISQEPDNPVYPFLSNRKVETYETIINEQNKKLILNNLRNLYIKMDSLLTYPVNDKFLKNCYDIIGFVPKLEVAENGKRAYHVITPTYRIELTKLGDGIPHILGLLADLTIEKDKLFVIEEIENDIHPTALKKMLELIVESSMRNQFFISTHSNIVLKELGRAKNAKIFHVTNDQNDKEFSELKISKLQEVANNQYERRQVLENLGYEFADSDLWKGWLLLEEASAESIINKYLIPWFVPKLQGQLRTFSTNGYTNTKKKLLELQSTFVFLYLEPIYKNKVWIILDNGESESKVISEIKEIAQKNDWLVDRFIQTKFHDFENFYPSSFENECNELKLITDKLVRQEKKKEMLFKLFEIADSDEENAKILFKESFSDIIAYLKEISNLI